MKNRVDIVLGLMEQKDILYQLRNEPKLLNRLLSIVKDKDSLATYIVAFLSDPDQLIYHRIIGIV